jgi:hypothetical protein
MPGIYRTISSKRATKSPFCLAFHPALKYDMLIFRTKKDEDLDAMQIIKWRLSLVALILCTMLGSSCVQSNNSPVIESLTAEPPVVTQGKSATVKCVASDPDGDELSYQWVATKGNISGQGSTVTWMAPSTCGDYVITVTATDSKDGEASRELTIEVKKPG